MITKIKEIFNEIKTIVASSLFPKHCICCEEIIDDNETLCDYCSEMLERIDISERCMTCGSQMDRCECKHRIFHFDGIIAPFYSCHFARKAFYKFKLSHKDYRYLYFANEMAKSVITEYKHINFDCVCYVPMDKSNQLRKGFNQSELLAREIAKLIKVPIAENLLVCNKKGKGQHNLKGKERFLNVRGIYEYTKKVNFKNVLLVDDIKTTGATLDECARKLLFAGAHHVYCVTALINYRKKEEKNGN